MRRIFRVLLSPQTFLQPVASAVADKHLAPLRDLRERLYFAAAGDLSIVTPTPRRAVRHAGDALGRIQRVVVDRRVGRPHMRRAPARVLGPKLCRCQFLSADGVVAHNLILANGRACEQAAPRNGRWLHLHLGMVMTLGSKLARSPLARLVIFRFPVADRTDHFVFALHKQKNYEAL